MSSEEETSQTSSSPSSPSSSSSLPPLHFIGRKEDIVKAQRVTKLVNGCREVLVLFHQGQLYAMDLRCYRKLWALTLWLVLSALYKYLKYFYIKFIFLLLSPLTDSGGALQDGDIEVSFLMLSKWDQVLFPTTESSCSQFYYKYAGYSFISIIYSNTAKWSLLLHHVFTLCSYSSFLLGV